MFIHRVSYYAHLKVDTFIKAEMIIALWFIDLCDVTWDTREVNKESERKSVIMSALFDLADSDGEIPDIELLVRIQPYMVEPTRSQNAEQSDESSPESAPDSDEENEVAHLDDANNESETMNVDEW